MIAGKAGIIPDGKEKPAGCQAQGRVKKEIRVVGAIIWNKDRFLICQRPEGKKRALLWEFPGGKVEPGETDKEALVREIREELGADIEVFAQVAETEYTYPDVFVRLYIYNAGLHGPHPRRLEHADMQWVTADQLGKFSFCPADREVLDKLAAGEILPPQVS